MNAFDYPDATGVDARAALYARYRKETKPFARWAFGEMDLPDGGRVLDLGCGPATLWASNADRFPEGMRLTLCDLSPGMLRDARARLDGAGIAAARTRANAEALPFPDGAFDAAVANHMLYDVVNLDAALAGLRRVLRPGGVLHATTNGARHLGEFRDALLSAGLRVEFSQRPAHGRFDLFTGATALSRHFAMVTTIRREEHLDVDSPEPLLAYADSIDHVRERLTSDIRRSFREIVNREIAEQGAFRVNCESGLLVAR